MLILLGCIYYFNSPQETAYHPALAWAASQYTDTTKTTKATLNCYTLHSYVGTLCLDCLTTHCHWQEHQSYIKMLLWATQLRGVAGVGGGSKRRMTASILKQDANAWTVQDNAIYLDKMWHANFWGNPVYQATKWHLTIKQWQNDEQWDGELIHLSFWGELCPVLGRCFWQGLHLIFLSFFPV